MQIRVLYQVHGLSFQPATTYQVHICGLIAEAHEDATAVHDRQIVGSIRKSFTLYPGRDLDEDTAEKIITAVRKLRHAADELEAELHKVEYGYDIS